jgi:hypothetical protein
LHLSSRCRLSSRRVEVLAGVPRPPETLDSILEDATMRKTALWTVAAVLALAGGLFAYELGFAGEEICKDQCPLIDSDRPDCHGKIECPLTGDLVCADRCPLGADRAKTAEVPSCCAQRR